MPLVTPTSGSEGPSSAVDALSRSAPRFLVYSGLLVFLLNMAFAWWVVIRSSDAINAPLMSASAPLPSGAASALQSWMANASPGTASDGASARVATAPAPESVVVLGRLIEADLYQRLVGSNQTLQIVGMAMGFAFLALGLSLYVLGIRGTFSLTAGLPDQASSARLALAASSPGLLCFVLSGLVTCIAITRDFDVRLGSADLSPVDAGPSPTRGRPPESRPLVNGRSASDITNLTDTFESGAPSVTAQSAAGDTVVR